MKAIIPVAGFGTRMLPASKAIPKELITLVDKPLIQYVVEEAYAAGIKEIVFVTHAAKPAIENHFDTNFELEWQLEQKGKTELLDIVSKTLPKEMSVSCVRQPKGLGLGHAVLCAKELVNSEDFVVLLPDVLLNEYESDLSKDNLSAMLRNFGESGRSQIMVERVPLDDVSKYGIADLPDSNIKEGCSAKVKGFVEKPDADTAPSNLAVVGRYVLSKSIWSLLETTAPGSGNEIQLTDAIDELIKHEGVDVFYMSGKSHDCGNLTGYVQTFIEYSLNNDKYKTAVESILKNAING